MCNVASLKIVVWFNGLVPVSHVLVFCASDYEYFHHCVTVINMQEVAAEVVMKHTTVIELIYIRYQEMEADLMFRWKGHELQPTLLMNLSQTQRDKNHWNKQPAGYMVIYFNQYFN